MEQELKPIPQLEPIAIRILGCLLEKSKTTPEYYPLSLNALSLACNQKSARKPVVNYTENEIIVALDQLKSKGWVSTLSGAGSRTIKYKHNLNLHYALNPDALAILCLLFLRGPLTPGEINSNSGRLYDFENLEEVQNGLNQLTEGPMPFVTQVARQSGQKEIRYRHLFGSYEEVAALQDNSDENVQTLQLTERVNQLETEVQNLKTAFEKLLKELGVQE